LSCARTGSVTAHGTLVPEDRDGNITLYISNQDRTVDPLDVRVSLDGVPIIRATVAIGELHPSYEEYHFKWTPGVHELRVESPQVPSKLISPVDVATSRWVSVLYGYPPQANSFALVVNDEAPEWF